MIHHHIARCFTTYTTSREIHIKSTILATTHLIIVITVWVAYLSSLDLDIKNVYQRSCPVQGAVTIKVKGQLSTEGLNDSEFAVDNLNLYKRTYDASDLVFPPFGDADGSFVAVTNLLITPNQTRARCPETSKSAMVHCNTNKDCIRGKTAPSYDGVLTGTCLQYSGGTCEISTWCPVESNIFPLKANRALLQDVANFTVLIKNSVEFPECGKDLHYRNILDTFTSNYLEKCIHKVGEDNYCPILRLGDVVSWSGQNFSTVSITGGLFKIELKWECDFDWGFTSNVCFPKYSFELMDEPNSSIAPGFNFRSSYYHEEHRRTLIKMYGIKFVIVISGQGKKFDFLQLILAFGATIALFDLAPLVCDTLFHFFCYLKRFSPFTKHFGDFSAKARYSDMKVGNSMEEPQQ